MMLNNSILDCTVLSKQGATNYDKLRSVTIPAFSGEMQVLPKHAEAFILLKKGDIVLQAVEDKKIIVVSEGCCYVKNNHIVIIL